VAGEEERAGVRLTNLDQELFPDAGVTKRDLIDYLDALGDRMITHLQDRPLSVVRVLRGQAPFMQKNLAKYTPDWVPRVSMWAESSHREVTYALGNDLRTLLWFGNQRAVEYHPTLFRVDRPDRPTHLVMDLDPPEGADFRIVVATAHLVRRALTESGMAGAVKTSGSKGLHIFVPVTDASTEEVAAATRALAARAEQLDPTIATTAFIREDRAGKVFLDSTRAGGATVVSAYSPRLRPRVPVSFPVPWDELDSVTPGDFTLRTAPQLLGEHDVWTELQPAPQPLAAALVEQGRTIPIARVQAMHEGKRRKRAERRAEAPEQQP
jgi:DNA ligase D-like protein (predicted polymerase)